VRQEIPRQKGIGQALRPKASPRETCVSYLLQRIRQQVQVHLTRQREAQGHYSGHVGAMQDLPHMLSRSQDPGKPSADRCGEEEIREKWEGVEDLAEYENCGCEVCEEYIYTRKKELVECLSILQNTTQEEEWVEKTGYGENRRARLNVGSIPILNSSWLNVTSWMG